MSDLGRAVKDTATLFREFLRSPVAVGALSPSSAALAHAATAPVPATGDPLVVELGPGTGPFTRVIQERLGGRGTHLAMEINERLAALVAERWPHVIVVNDSAANLPAVLAGQGLGKADVIVSSLPWAAFGSARQELLLKAAIDSLGDAGTFTTFTYAHARPLPPAVRFFRRLQASFDEVHVSPVVWRNVPPAVIYFATGPRR